VIPRYQTVLLVVLLVASIAMGGVLWHLRQRAHQRLLEGEDSTPTQAPAVAPVEQAKLEVASEATNSLSERILSLPLPQNPEARARMVLGKLLDFYSAPDAAHPVPGGAGSVAEVFLLPIATGNAPAAASGSNHAAASSAAADQLAVVNLTGAFASNHPSGLESETLTILSICATLHANLPHVAQVRFLVDGQPRATLAGHADLTRIYLTAETVPTEGAHP
jgi:hypothetical protein